jgi:anti-anti-sigma factor
VGGIRVNETGSAGNTVVTVQVSAEVGADTAGELRGALVGAILRRRPARIVVDLQAVSVLDSASVGTLSAAYDAARDVDLNLVLHSPGAAVSDQLHDAGVPTCSCARPAGGQVRAA